MRRNRSTDPSLFWEECLAVLVHQATRTGSVTLSAGDLYTALAECTLGERPFETKYNWWGHKLRNVASVVGESPQSATEGTRVWIRKAFEIAERTPAEARDLAARALTGTMGHDLAVALFGNNGVVDLGNVGLESGQTIDAEAGFDEGARKLVLHYRRERDSGASRTAKLRSREQHNGRLFCEVCQVDPEASLGYDIIEAHHIVPLSQAEGTIRTTAADFAMLCPNCHRSVHQIPDCNLSVLRERTFAR